MNTRIVAGIALVAVIGMAGTSVAAGATSTGAKVSKPEFVSSACSAPQHGKACRVALRYLAALDLDRRREACRLLAPSTLEAAGGLRGCVRTLATASGVRIRYAILGARVNPLGTTVRFSTQGESDTPVVQEMLVSRRGRITMVLPVGLYEPTGHGVDV